MNDTDLQRSDEQHKAEKPSLFIFLGGHNFWEGLYDSVNIAFIQNLVQAGLLNQSDILMTTIINKENSGYKPELLRSKERTLQDDLNEVGIQIRFFHIQGRSLKGMSKAIKGIEKIASLYQKRYVWAQNYFNCQIGHQVKRSLKPTHLHFDMRGLVPQEELHYSSSNLLKRVAKYLVLQFLEKKNLQNSDSVSVVSNRFLTFINEKYRLESKPSLVFPNFFDEDKFFINPDLRTAYRNKYQISENQKLILYSGMLQKWQDPDLLFTFIKHIRKQDHDNEFRFFVLTYDQQKANEFTIKYGIENLIIDNADGEALNGIYNAADIGLAFRDENIASVVSCPVKIPEYLATGNSIILLESIGDFGRDLAGKNYVMVRHHKEDFLAVTVEDLHGLQKPDPDEQDEIFEKYSMRKNIHILRKILHE